MARSISGTWGTSIRLEDAGSGDVESGTILHKFLQTWDITNGTGGDQVNLVWTDKRTLGSGLTEALDVSGSLASLLGTNVFAKVKGLIFVAATTNTTTLTVSRPASNGLPFLKAAGDAFDLLAGDKFELTRRGSAGIAVSAGSADLIQVDNSAGASADYYVGIVGTDA